MARTEAAVFRDAGCKGISGEVRKAEPFGLAETQHVACESDSLSLTPLFSVKLPFYQYQHLTPFY